MSAKSKVKAFSDKLRKAEMQVDNPNKPLVTITDISLMTDQEILEHEI